MEHRYGRHGPHAWRKQRKHKFEQTSIVPVFHTAVVYVQLPVIYAERVIIVINTGDLPDGIEPNKKIVSTTPTYISAFNQEPRQASNVDPFHEIKKAIRSEARIEAMTQAEADYDKLEEYPTRDQRYPTIQEILLVASRWRAVRHYHRVGSHVWNETLYEDEDDVIDLACIGVSLSVRDIYFKVYLELEEQE